jgi:ribulose-phosphate 3-epimerase
LSIRIAPSLLSADFAALGDAVRAAERGGADFIHVDVMDGHFVPNITIGPLVVRAIKRVATAPLDVHLMISDPDRYIDAFAEAGAAYLTVHVEALPHLHRTLSYIRSLGLKAGVALNPSTPVSSLDEIAAEADLILVMSVNPGFGAQSFIPRAAAKIRAVREMLDRIGGHALIEVDGGIDLQTVGAVVSAGVDVLVAGNAIFGTPDPAAAARALRAAAERAQRSGA